MSHTIHQKKAFVLNTIPFGEANMSVDLLTEDMGLIRATAQGIRYLKSKLRYSVTKLSLITLSVVRGKEVWRLVGATKINDFYFELDEEKSTTLEYLALLIRRFVQGEEPHVDLFILFEKTSLFLHEYTLQKEELIVLEDLVTLRLLYGLGYVQKNVEFELFLNNLTLSREMLEDFKRVVPQARSQVEQALRESGL